MHREDRAERCYLTDEERVYKLDSTALWRLDRLADVGRRTAQVVRPFDAGWTWCEAAIRKKMPAVELVAYGAVRARKYVLNRDE